MKTGSFFVELRKRCIVKIQSDSIPEGSFCFWKKSTTSPSTSIMDDDDSIATTPEEKVNQPAKMFMESPEGKLQPPQSGNYQHRKEKLSPPKRKTTTALKKIPPTTTPVDIRTPKVIFRCGLFDI
ncbi:hypothetical protein JTB14_004310 [Gonioctena quinquepunctata]|nr:hypothetical protein JTB14_004310 [Gonioctena quinquepunctata]